MTWNLLANYLLSQAIMTAIVILIARRLRRFTGDSPARRLHGRYVYGWTIGCFLFGGVTGIVIGDKPNGSHGWSMFLLLFGWLVGTIRGGFVVSGHPSLKPDTGNPADNQG